MAANARLGSDTFFSEEELMPSKRFMNKLWNASKFTLMHLQDINEKLLSNENKPNLLPVDKWMLERIKQTMITATKLLNQYEIGLARHEIDDLFWKDFCDDYLEIVKDRLYKPHIHGEEERHAAQYTIYYALLNILKLYAIYIPHQTEYIYQSFFRQYENCISIHQMNWKTDGEVNESILEFGIELKKVIGEIRKFKSENNLSMKAELKEFTILTNKSYINYFIKESKDIKACGTIENLDIQIKLD